MVTWSFLPFAVSVILNLSIDFEIPYDLLHFALLHYGLEKLLHFALVFSTFCGVSYYILR